MLNLEDSFLMKITIVTSCTGEKLYKPDNQLNKEDLLLDHESQTFLGRIQELKKYETYAEEMYTGQQHVRLMDGVNSFRSRFGQSSIDLCILSAGYGFIPGEQRIVPYECTFQGMKKKEIHSLASHLSIPEKAREIFSRRSDLTLVLLGENYLKALELDENVQFNTPTVFFSGSGAKKQILGHGDCTFIPLSNPEAKKFSCGLIGLKGEIAKLILKGLVEANLSISQLLESPETVISKLEKFMPKKVVKGNLIPKASKNKNPKAKTPRIRIDKPELDYVVQLPDSYHNKPHRKKVRYFIPEWDDLVDPDYDFKGDNHSAGMGGWATEVYAHQMYPEPNYDGILVSKVVAEKSKKKKELINKMGVHRYLRLPEEFPIMGDCGAFGYVNEDVPPYTTEEILDYYTRLGFDYGVSIDHMIVKATEEQWPKRYDITMKNAEDFINKHRKLGLTWTPVGAVQGWDPKSYAEAAKAYVEMGYTYLGLGGLARTSTNQIIPMLEELHQVVPENVDVHLFGVARIKDILSFNDLGVTSVDSASYLRRAWLGAGQNYFSLDGKQYAAIRVPEAGKSFRAKRMVSEGRVTAERAEELEQECLQALRNYAKGKLDLEKTLDIIDSYDQLITPDRKSHRALYGRTLYDRPWEKCPCPICQKDGVEVVIFRGNNRNRRRGFHNTYVFYQLYQQTLLGQCEFYSGRHYQETLDQLDLEFDEE